MYRCLYNDGTRTSCAPISGRREDYAKTDFYGCEVSGGKQGGTPSGDAGLEERDAETVGRCAPFYVGNQKGSGMAVRLDDLQGSTDVFGSNGEKVGQVHGIATVPGTGARFLEVRTGFGGIGGADLWIPEEAIAVAVMGEPVRLKVTHDVARERYVTKPGVL